MPSRKRERVDTGRVERHPRRNARGRFPSDPVDTSRASAADQRQRSVTPSRRRQGDRGDSRGTTAPDNGPPQAAPVARAVTGWSRASVNPLEPLDIAFVEPVPSLVVRVVRRLQILLHPRYFTLSRRERHFRSLGRVNRAHFPHLRTRGA
jgi:hypothetical protein